MKYPIDSIISVEVPVVNASQRQIYFPESQLLRGKKIAMVLPSNMEYNPSGKKNYNQGNIFTTINSNGCYLVLKSGNNEIINRLYIPTLYDLQRVDYDLLYIGKEIDLQKCYIETAAGVVLDTSYSFHFQFIVINENPQPKPITPRRVEYVELLFKSAAEKKLYFPDDIKLRDLQLVSFIVPNAGGTSPTGNKILPLFATFGGVIPLFVTLFNRSGKTIFDRVPIGYFLNIAYVSGFIYLNRLDVDFSISYLEYVNPDSLNEGSYFLFNIVHEKQ